MRHPRIAAWLLMALAAAPAANAAEPRTGALAQRLEALAAQRDPEAEYHLGMLYNNGLGVPKDPHKALDHFRASAEAGDPLGAYKLGCYYAGQFGLIAPDEALALKYKLVAARAGYSLAQDDVATLYLTRHDYAGALPWLEAAAHQGYSHALYNLSALYNEGLGVPKSPARAAAFFRLAQLAAHGRVGPDAQQSLDELRRKMSPEEWALAEQITATWTVQRTPLTTRAMAGLQRAKALAQGH